MSMLVLLPWCLNSCPIHLNLQIVPSTCLLLILSYIVVCPLSLCHLEYSLPFELLNFPIEIIVLGLIFSSRPNLLLNLNFELKFFFLGLLPAPVIYRIHIFPLVLFPQVFFRHHNFEIELTALLWVEPNVEKRLTLLEKWVYWLESSYFWVVKYALITLDIILLWEFWFPGETYHKLRFLLILEV